MSYVSVHGRKFGFDSASRQVLIDLSPIGEIRGQGRDFYVDSNTGQATGSGSNPDEALSTVTLALAKCTANRGDRVFLLPGHAETIGNETLAWAKAGVEIIGLGRGAKQARFHHNHASALITIGANDMAIRNCRFSADVTSVAVGIDVLAGFDDFVLDRCLFDTVTGGTDEYTIGVQINAGCDRAVVEGNVFDMGIAATAVSVKLTGASDRPTIRGNQFYGDASSSHICGITTLSTRVLIEDNLIVQGVGGDVGAVAAITLLTGTTGIIRHNNTVANLTTIAGHIVADTCFRFENYGNEDINLTGILIGAVTADD